MRIQNEMEWREALKEGDKLDALKVEKVFVDSNQTGNRISSWSSATVERISEDRKQVVVVYKGDYN